MGLLPDGTRVLPWANWPEWLELKDMLTVGEIEQAKARAALYQVRRRGSVPISVLSSVALASQLKNPSPDPYTQRLGLSMAITRLVNGLTDRIQPRGQGASARSVHKLAMELGLPLTLVDIRHQSCHNLLPRLSALESGAKQALFWLEQFYWKPQHLNLMYHLPKSLVDLKHVFQNSTEQTLEGEGFESTLLGLNCLSSQDHADSPIVNKMRQMTKRLKDRRKLSISQAPIGKGRSGTKRWRRCENPEVWKTLSLGLIPGQKRPPCLKKINFWSESSSHTRENPHDAPRDESTPTVSGDDMGARKSHEESFRRRKLNRTTEEDRTITTLTNHFRSLVSNQPANTTI